MLFGAEHTRRYRETGGEEGHDWQGTQTLILTTTGRKSGETRDAPLIYGRSGDDYLIVASKGGAPQPPGWFLNLEANPDVEIQVHADRLKVHARVATPDEKPALWQIMTKEWPAYDEYQTKTDRQIPVVVLEPLIS
jgi:deazaflavin-dependent oxidoreductase (nitroreductase family)